MKNIEEYNIIHYCSTAYGSAGSPILLLSNKKIIGMHINRINKCNYNIGTLLKYPINEYLNMTNEKENNIIKIKIKIEKENIFKNIYFLDNTDDIYKENGYVVEHHHDNLKELNELNTEVFINNIKYKYEKYFKPEKEGLYEIILIFKIKIKDCSYMFFGSCNLTSIDLSSFNTKNVTNMSY